MGDNVPLKKRLQSFMESFHKIPAAARLPEALGRDRGRVTGRVPPPILLRAFMLKQEEPFPRPNGRHKLGSALLSEMSRRGAGFSNF